MGVTQSVNSIARPLFSIFLRFFSQSEEKRGWIIGLKTSNNLTIKSMMRINSQPEKIFNYNYINTKRRNGTGRRMEEYVANPFDQIVLRRLRVL